MRLSGRLAAQVSSDKRCDKAASLSSITKFASQVTSHALYVQALMNMRATVHELARRVPSPKMVPFSRTFGYRHVEKTIHQALVQKLARYASSLQAAQILLDAGFLQEQAALQRILDEIQEDISFLPFSIIFKNSTPLHQQYLDAFYEEEFDEDTAMESTQKRPMISRQKVRAYIARSAGTTSNSSTGVEAARTISKAYSGYVHAASPQIMDMFGGSPPRFHMTGMKGTPREEEHRQDLWNYYYRGILAFGFVAKSFGDDEMFSKITSFADQFFNSDNRSC
jgi:hypothetical protein